MYQCTNTVSSVVMFVGKEGWVRMTYKAIIQQSQISCSCSKRHHHEDSVRYAGLYFEEQTFYSFNVWFVVHGSLVFGEARAQVL